MSKRKTYTPKLIGARSAFIDPMTCHSRISHTCVFSKYGALSMAIQLSDCDRQIKWEMWEDSATDPLKKLDRAIEELQAARATMVAGLAFFKKKRPRTKTKYARA